MMAAVPTDSAVPSEAGSTDGWEQVQEVSHASGDTPARANSGAACTACMRPCQCSASSVAGCDRRLGLFGSNAWPMPMP